MKIFVCVLCLISMLVFPVSAVAILDGDVVDGDVSDPSASSSSDPSDPFDSEVPSDPQAPAQEDDSDLALAAVTDALSGGFYFVADCALGSDVTFYVPVEWAYDRFALDPSGEPVNLSTSTCYAYSPDYPTYTFSCSRFGSFTYRSSNYDTQDLNVRNISDTNISFFDGNGIQLSESELQLLCCILLFVVIGILIFKKG